MGKIIVLSVIAIFAVFFCYCLVMSIIRNKRENKSNGDKPSGQYSDNQKNVYSQR